MSSFLHFPYQRTFRWFPVFSVSRSHGEEQSSVRQGSLHGGSLELTPQATMPGCKTMKVFSISQFWSFSKAILVFIHPISQLGRNELLAAHILTNTWFHHTLLFANQIGVRWYLLVASVGTFPITRAMKSHLYYFLHVGFLLVKWSVHKCTSTPSQLLNFFSLLKIVEVLLYISRTFILSSMASSTRQQYQGQNKNKQIPFINKSNP